MPSMPVALEYATDPVQPLIALVNDFAGVAGQALASRSGIKAAKQDRYDADAGLTETELLVAALNAYTVTDNAGSVSGRTSASVAL
jgi:hypothetical protein